MRRHCRKRIFTLFFGCLIFYIGGYVFVSISEVTRDSTEKIVYLHALRRSSPMEHNIELCSSNDIDLIIIIISSSSHFLERESIRETWGSMPNLMNIRSQFFGYLMDSKTRNLLTEEGLKDKSPFRFSDVYITGILPERLRFICNNIPFTYHLGSTDECINIIKKQNVESSRSPLIVCSTSLIPAYKFLDFYRIWTVLKHVYKNRMYSTQGVFLLYQNKNKETVLTLLRYLSTNI
ncbi:unnamed protein product [Rotaria socialis]|uniref:Hexosyltransferase n=1 Tax=Rotaria socialis TaxID=392032 RepID=A0A821BC77_9BILA|nr:unnamed protein product [Rotaria socialis]